MGFAASRKGETIPESELEVVIGLLKFVNLVNEILLEVPQTSPEELSRVDLVYVDTT